MAMAGVRSLRQPSSSMLMASAGAAPSAASRSMPAKSLVLRCPIVMLPFPQAASRRLARQLLLAEGEERLDRPLAIGCAPLAEAAETVIVVLVVGIGPATDLGAPVGRRIDIGARQEIAKLAPETVMHLDGVAAAIFQHPLVVVDIVEGFQPLGRHGAVGVCAASAKGQEQQRGGGRTRPHGRNLICFRKAPTSGIRDFAAAPSRLAPATSPRTPLATPRP